MATTSGHFVHKSERRTKNGGVHIRPVCYFTGSVKGDSEVGGVCGRNNDPITACYSAGSVEEISNVSSMVGGICGNNNSTITACYCTNSSLSEISYNSGNATKVEEVNGTSVTWTDGDNSALSVMNDAISQSKYKYTENTDPDTSAGIPLVLVQKK